MDLRTTMKVTAISLLAAIAIAVSTMVAGTTRAEAPASPHRYHRRPAPKTLNDAQTMVPPSVIEQAVFKVLPWTPDHQRAGGTGFLLNHPKRGTVIVTNKHVCEALTNELNAVYFVEQDAYQYVARQLHKSDETDLCLISPPPELVASHRALELAPTELLPGQHVNVYGHPYLNPLTYVQGHFLNVSREPLNFRVGSFDPSFVFLIGHLDFMVHPGNSGSPVLNDLGQVEGVVFAMEGENHIGLTIPHESLSHFLETLE